MKKKRETKAQRIRREAREAAEQQERDEFEARHIADREAAERAERERRETDELVRKEREERLAKEKAQDEKLAQLQVELVSLEKTYLETVHLFELAQIDLTAPPVGSTGNERERALNLAQQLHHIRMVGAARMHEFEALYAQVKHDRSSSSLWGSPWLGYLLIGGVAMYAYSLFKKAIPRVEKK